MPTNDLRTFDEDNKVLWTVPAAFARREKVLLSWLWKPTVNEGNDIVAGDEIADIQWDDSTIEIVTAPADCTGPIQVVNRDILYENLRYMPPQRLLSIL